MAREWESQYPITETLALSSIQKQFPSLKASSISFFGAGWDNTVFLINQRYLFQFPRREQALPLLDLQVKALPKIAPFLPLKIPVPLWRGAPTDEYPYPFMGYELLKGETACKAHLTQSEKDALAIPLAFFLKALHAIPFSLGKESGISCDRFRALDVPFRIPRLMDNLRELKKYSLLKAFFEESLFETRFGSLLPSQEITLVHGDLYIRHLIVDTKHSLVGIIDWGDMHLGDPAVDFMVVHSLFSSQGLLDFRHHYGPISENAWELSFFKSIYSNSVTSVYGFHQNDTALLREGLEALEKLLPLVNHEAQ